MKKHSVKAVVSTIGLDLGDKQSRVCVLDAEGKIAEEGSVATTASAFTRKFKGMARHRIVIETGTHANWVHDELVSFGHEVVVANARRLRAISANERKCDERDARMLAMLGRNDIRLLAPVQVRPAQIREDLAMFHAREALVGARTELVNSLRGLSKSLGKRVPSSSTASLHKKPLDPAVKPALQELQTAIGKLTELIDEYEKKLEQIAEQRYPRTKLLRQVSGVGLLVSLYFVLIIGDIRRFKDSRAVGPYIGLVPRRDQSGERDPQLPITKCGSNLGRKLLVQGAQYIVGPFGPDTDLKRFGLRLSERGGKGAKKRAIVAVARKLATLLFALLRNGTEYEPLRASTPRPPRTQSA